MKPTRHILLTMALLLCSLTASAHDFEVGGIYYNITSEADKTAEVTFKGDEPYQGGWYSASITIPATVTHNSVEYSVTSIGEHAFYDCSSLTSITLPENSQLTSIGERTFQGCSSLTSITLPASVTSIGYGAFRDCSRLTSITIPEGVTSIGNDAFYNTAWYDNQPDGVIYVGRVLYKYKGTMPANTSVEVKEGTVSIGNYAFDECSSLTSINIPASVTSIGYGAFRDCSRLTSITFPEGVTSIGNDAFDGCSSLTSITLPENSQLTSIGERAFQGCSSLTAITIPASVTSIGGDAFYGCSSLTTINVAEGNANYDSRGGCNAIIEKGSNTLIAGCAATIIPEGVTSIGDKAFYNCSSLTAITIPESVTSIGRFAFNYCSSLTSITIPESVTSIGYCAFNGTAWYDNQPDGVIYAGNVLYEYKGDMPENTTIEVKEGTVSIGISAFRDCSSLTAITIPSSLTSIGDYAFRGCSRLTDVFISAETPPTIGTSVFPNNSIYIYVPASSVGAYKSAEGWSGYKNIQPTDLIRVDGIWYEFISKAKIAKVSTTPTGIKYAGSISIPATVTYEGVTYSVTSIGSGAFMDCSGLTSITLPESVTSIGSEAFRGCTGELIVNCNIPSSAFYGSRFTKVTISEGVTSIGYGAFRDCSRLTSITIPEGVTSIGYTAFYNCSSLTSITIPEGVTSIEDYVFSDCSSLTSITLPESVMSIGYGAFRDCSSLTAITLPASVTSIGGDAFYGCSSLTSITIPEGVTSIGNGAFRDCSSLTSITLPENSQLTSIGERAFQGCSSLTAITIPEGVTNIGNWAFDGCSNLTAVHISSIEAWCEISFYENGSNPLYYAHNLYLDGELVTNLVIPESVTSIGNNAFSDCRSLTAIVLSEKLKSVGSKAFANCTELLDVYCYAKSVPSAYSNAFDGSYPEYITLHVPSNALESYKTTAPWSSFGTIVAFGASITDITLSQSSATLYEGESLALVAVVTPDNAKDKTVTWSSSDESVATVNTEGQVTAIAVGNAIITATVNDGSGVSASCEVEVKEKLLGKCATPVVNYVDGKVMLTCETEEATIVSVTNETTEHAVGECEETEFDLIPTYTITAYATKAKYETSDVVTVTLCWIDCSDEHENDDADGIITIPSQPVLISTQGGTITLTGLAEGTDVAVYTTAGTQLGTATAVSGTATITTSLTTGNTAIMKIGNSSIKVVVK